MGLKYFHSRQLGRTLTVHTQVVLLSGKSKQQGKHVICTEQVCKG